MVVPCRYCNYQISRKGGAAPDPAALLELEGAAGPGMDILQVGVAALIQWVNHATKPRLTRR